MVGSCSCTTFKLFRIGFKSIASSYTALGSLNHILRTSNTPYRRMSSKNEGILLQDVVKQLGNFASTKLAESWDNVGLLVEPSGCHKVRKILLTNDLTQAVMKESINKSIDMIISYHPPIFKPLKRLSQGNWKERIITLSIENRIAIYSPHTCYDAVKGGVNDWLLSCFGNGKAYPLTQSFDSSVSSDKPNGCYKISLGTDESTNLAVLGKTLEESREVLKTESFKAPLGYCLHVYIAPLETALATVYGLIQQSNIATQTTEIIKLDKLPLPGYGMGRILQLDESICINEVIAKVKQHLEIPHVRLALARKISVDKKISTIAVCAGSGGSLLNGVNADVYVTGEMSHHEVLHATESGRTVLLCEHSNTERGFLKRLTSLMTGWFDGEISIQTSEEDKDPIIVV